MLGRSTLNFAKSLVQAPIRSYHGGVPGAVSYFLFNFISE